MPFQFRKEAIEEDLNSNFPSQGQGNPPLYYSLSEVVVPTYSINSVAEGSGLAQNLQTAWDFSTGHQETRNASDTIINTPGFWLINVNLFFLSQSGTNPEARIDISDGVTAKDIWRLNESTGTAGAIGTSAVTELIVFVRSGDSVIQTSTFADIVINSVYRQIATVNGELVNPLGFSFA